MHTDTLDNFNQTVAQGSEIGWLRCSRATLALLATGACSSCVGRGSAPGGYWRSNVTCSSCATGRQTPSFCRRLCSIRHCRGRDSSNAPTGSLGSYLQATTDDKRGNRGWGQDLSRRSHNPRQAGQWPCSRGSFAASSTTAASPATSSAQSSGSRQINGAAAACASSCRAAASCSRCGR